jgi:hypothetical protein
MRNILTLILSTLLLASASYSQYCTPVYSTACSSADFINNFSTTGGASNITNNATGCNGNTNNYIYYSALTCSQVQGQTITLNMQSGSSWSQGFRVWIDWNNNNSFADAGEDVYSAPSSTAMNTGTITVPFSATPGTVRMRVMCRYATTPLTTDYCATTLSFGEVEDYNFTVIGSTLCTGTPTAGVTTSSSAAICPSVPFGLSLTGATLAAGLTYQWQSSTDGVTYANIVGATNSGYAASQTVNTYYQCIVTCTASGASSTSTPVYVTTNSFINCYCTSAAQFTSYMDIQNVTLGTLNNSSTCTSVGGPGSTASLYNDYTTTVAAPTLAASAAYPFSLTIGNCGSDLTNATKIWIDYNQNGLFTDPGENVYTSVATSPGTHVETGSFTVPVTATVGLTRMRIVNSYNTVPSSISPCGTYNYGETEDYLVNIAPVPTCPQPTGLSLVGADYTTATLQWVAGGTETQWQIEYGPQGFAIGTGTTVLTSSNPYTITGLDSTEFYQAYISGICTPGDTSYWAGTISWNTYDQDQYMDWNSDCPSTGFVDISTSGTDLLLTDDTEAGVTLPFPFLYQGQLINDITVGNNGGIILGTLNGAVGYGGNMTTLGNSIWPWGDDLDDETGNVYYQTIGTAPNRTFIVQWDNICNFSGSVTAPTVTFEVLIEEATQEIYFVYTDVVFGGTNVADDYAANADIGVGGPNQDINISNNNATYLQNNSCAHFYYTDCPAPKNFTIAYVAPDEAAFSWTTGLAGETNWTIIYGPAGFDPLAPGASSITSTTPNAVLPSLTQLTCYDVYIYSDCNPSLQSSVGLFGTFCTPPFCSNPTAMINTVAVDSIMTSWSWTEFSPAYPSTSFNITYGMNGFDLYTEGTELALDNNTTDTITNSALMAGGVYQLYVQAVCTNDTSSYIGPFTVIMPLANDTVCSAEMLTVDGPVYTFNNTGATVSTGETAIAPPTTGAQTTDGWINSVLNNTTWFKFVAPASGNIRINNTAINYAGQTAVYEGLICNDFNTFSFVAGNDNDITGTSNASNFTVCGLTPGNTYYLMHDGNTGTVGNYSINITSINLEAGSFVDVLDVCTGDTVDLFNGITGYQSNGVWSAELASAETGVYDSLFNSAGLAYQVFNFEYRLTDGCAYDSIVSQVQIFPPSSAGNDGTLTVCRNEPIDLLAGLTGNVDFGGTWYDPSNVVIPSSEIIGSNIPGQFNYDYITGNGVCPNDTANVLVTINGSCNYLNVEDMYFHYMSLYPNPTNGLVYITNEGSTETFDYVVTDIEGRVIASQSAAINGTSTTSINLNGKVTGVYMIRIFNENAEKVFRVVLQ